MVTTAEGQVYRLGAAPRGAVAEIVTAEPYRTRVHVTLPDGRKYELMVPPFGMVTS